MRLEYFQIPEEDVDEIVEDIPSESQDETSTPSPLAVASIPHPLALAASPLEKTTVEKTTTTTTTTTGETTVTTVVTSVVTTTTTTTPTQSVSAPRSQASTEAPTEIQRPSSSSDSTSSSSSSSRQASPPVALSTLNKQPSTSEIIARITKRRGGPSKLLDLDRTLLHSPPIADGWNSFLGAIRDSSSSPQGLPDTLREMAICRVAVLNSATYEWAQHAPLLRQAILCLYPASNFDFGRLASAKTANIAEIPAMLNLAAYTSMRSSNAATRFTDLELLTLLYTDVMTKNVHVEPDVFVKVSTAMEHEQRTHATYSPDAVRRLMVELTATIAAYNCVSRFLVALDVGEQASQPIEPHVF